MSTENQTERPEAVASAEAWEAARVHKGVTLPSGTVVDLQLPDLPEMAKAGDIPNELLADAGKLQEAIETKDRAKITTETLANVAEFMRFLLPRMILKPEITEEQVPRIPSADKEMLVAFAQRARDIDAVGRHLAGLETLASWRRFRGFDDESAAVGGI